jgi:hypothetical protein
MNKLKLRIGDYSGDGHEKSETFYFLSNRTSSEIKEIIEKSNQLTGIDFEHLFSDYEQYNLTEEEISTLEEKGIDFSKVIKYFYDSFTKERDEYGFSTDDAVNLFMEYLKLSDSELIINLTNDDYQEIDISFGYGLFE